LKDKKKSQKVINIKKDKKDVEKDNKKDIKEK